MDLKELKRVLAGLTIAGLLAGGAVSAPGCSSNDTRSSGTDKAEEGQRPGGPARGG